MLQIKNLTIFNTKDLRPIIENFSFVLNAKDKAVIIGEEGNGKSTLLKTIFDQSLVSSYTTFSGEIVKRGEILGYLPQELPRTDENKTLYEYFSGNEAFLHANPKELSKIANDFCLDKEIFFDDRRLCTLSGGEKVKVQFAYMLLTHPTILLLDEPTNDIDIPTLCWLENFISNCDLPVLFISHDETVIERTANTVIHLERLRKKKMPHFTVARLPYSQYVSQRQSNFARQEQVSNKEKAQFDKKMETYRKIAQKVEHQQSTISRQNPQGGRLLKKKMKSVISMGKRFEKERQNLAPLPEYEDCILLDLCNAQSTPKGKRVLEFSLPVLEIGQRKLSQNIALTVFGGQKVCITGLNGAGKTTLLRQIAKQMENRQDIKVAYMPQNYADLLPNNVTPVEFLCQKGDKEEKTEIRTLLGSMKFTAEETEHSVQNLSGGQKAKLFFLKMKREGANVLLLDEPTRNFSPLSNPIIRQILCDFCGTIISVSHDRKYIEYVCDTVFRLDESGLTLLENEQDYL